MFLAQASIAHLSNFPTFQFVQFSNFVQFSIQSNFSKFILSSRAINWRFQSCLLKAYVDGDMYNIDINVQQFKPEELVIKTVGQTVQVEAKHEEKTSDGASYSTRNFSQSFTLPRGVDPESVASSLSKDGKLTIKAPMPKAHKISSNERLVPIKHNWTTYNNENQRILTPIFPFYN